MQLSPTIILIGLNVIASMYAWNNRDIYHKWMMNPYAVANKNEYHRFLTSGFIHLDQMHLFFNMFTLYFFGDNVERICISIFGSSGVFIYVGFFLAAIIISEIPTFLKHKTNPGYNSLGASGGVAAVVFCHILFFPLDNLYLFAIIPIPGFLLGILYLFYSYRMSHSGRDGINHDAHLYGALFGIAFSILIYPGILMQFFERLTEFRLPFF